MSIEKNVMQKMAVIRESLKRALEQDDDVLRDAVNCVIEFIDDSVAEITEEMEKKPVAFFIPWEG